jgi:hypothetical protein
MLELPYKLKEPILYTSYGWEVNGSKGDLSIEQLTRLNDWLKSKPSANTKANQRRVRKSK